MNTHAECIRLQELAVDGRMAKALSGRRKFTGDGRIHIRVIVIGVAAFTNTQTVALHSLRTDNLGHPFIVRDVLELGNDDTLRFQKDHFVGPSRIEATQFVGNSVMLTGE